MITFIILLFLLTIFGVTLYFIISIIKNVNLTLSTKIAWLMLVLFVPIIGSVIYLIKEGRKECLNA